MDPRLKSKIIIDQLFTEGKSLFVFPVKLNYLHTIDAQHTSHIQYGVSVSKRTFKKAVDRNKIKRRMREALRLNVPMLIPHDEEKSHTAMMFIFVGKEMLEYKRIEKAIISLLHKLERPR